MHVCDANGTSSTHDLAKFKQNPAVLWHCNCTRANLSGSTVQNATSGSEGVREVLDRILSSYEEIDRRFSTAGGLGSLLNLYEQVRRELERVSYEEIDRMTLEIKSVIEALLKMDYELRKVNNLKLAFDGRSPGTAGSG
jgi:hypothetical protein